ncbi:MAG: hypothetical protein ACFE8B_02185 [Candidatus Hermodarchaeota archaeon]
MIVIKSDINEKELEEISEIRKYFSRIFTVFSKEIRDKLKHLNIPKEKKKILKKELAFLSNENQLKYLDELESIYD